jgi:hypothetical protein
MSLDLSFATARNIPLGVLVLARGPNASAHARTAETMAPSPPRANSVIESPRSPQLVVVQPAAVSPSTAPVTAAVRNPNPYTLLRKSGSMSKQQSPPL